MKIRYIMQDDLEKFIKENRTSFDDGVPSSKAWDNIAHALDQQETPQEAKVITMKTSTRRKRLYRLSRVAAVALIFTVIGGLIGSYLTTNQTSSTVQGSGLSSISQEYAELEEVYTRQVNNGLEQLKDHKMRAEVMKDLEELDAAYKGLEQEFSNSQVIDKEEIIHAMIENYQIKIEILERVLKRVHFEQEHDKSSEKTTVL